MKEAISQGTVRPRPESARKETNSTGLNNVVRFSPAHQKPQDGLVGLYRRQRTLGEAFRAIRNVLDKEVRLARLTGVHTPPQVLEDILVWITRGCIPS